MHQAHEFLTALAVVLCVAGLMTVVSQRLRLPLVLGYVLAGLVVGPHVPSGLVADIDVVQSLSELGVILLMFSLGLEFHLSRIARLGGTAGLTALIECSAMFFLGFTAAEFLGWSARESLFAGAVVTISSTTVIVKAFEEHGVRSALRERVVGILVFEDLIAILLLALLPAAAVGEALTWGQGAGLVARLGATLAFILIAGMLIVPRAMAAVLRLARPETTLVASLGVCFAGALIAQALGYSFALGAFVAGALVAESGESHAVEQLVRPVRDLFAAIFFVSVGMLIDPVLVAEHWQGVATLAGVVVVGKIVAVSLGVFLTGGGTRTAVESGMSLAQIGEFSFIIAGLGSTIGGGAFLYPVAVTISVLTMITTPWMIRVAPRVAAGLDRRLPPRVQTLATLYGGWVERIRGATRAESLGQEVRRLIGLLALDLLLLGALAIGLSLRGAAITAWLEQAASADARIARALVAAGAFALALPLALGVVRVSRRIGVALARLALPDAGEGALDLSGAPRRALVVTLQFGTVLLAGLPLLALTQPFIPAEWGVGALLLALAVLAIALWRGAADLQGHVRAGAAAIVEALSAQARPGKALPGAAAVEQLAAGLGEPEAFSIAADGAACGRTLSALNVRGATGATVLAITRSGRTIVYPGAQEVLQPNDLLALAGSREAVEAAKALLSRAASEPEPAKR